MSKEKMEKKLYYRVEPKLNAQYEIIKREKYAQGNWFLSEKEARADYKKAYQIAEEKHSQLMKGFAKLKEEIVDFSINDYMEGDTYGIYESGCYINITVNGYDIKFLL